MSQRSGLTSPVCDESRPSPELSVVIPVHNEEDCIGPLLDEVNETLAPLGREYEILIVDDGSVDRTPDLLDRLATANRRLRVIRWRRNRGQAAALYEGLRSASGSILVTMDGDGQNDPADLPALLARLQDSGDGSLDMIVGVRAARHDSLLRRWMSKLANGVRGRLLGDRMTDSGCALKAFRSEVSESFIPIQTLYSFMPAMAQAAGYRVGEMAVGHRPRTGGTSHYGLVKMLWRPLVDLIGMWWFVHRRFRGAHPTPPAPPTESSGVERSSYERDPPLRPR